MATRVLIVDDATFMRHLLKNILVTLDCEIVGEAADGEQACTLYDDLKPDLVTLDLVMPKKGGLETLKTLREKDPKARVVIISAIDQRQPLMDALKLGAADYVVKPFEKDRVQAALGRVLSN